MVATHFQKNKKNANPEKKALNWKEGGLSETANKPPRRKFFLVATHFQKMQIWQKHIKGKLISMSRGSPNFLAKPLCQRIMRKILRICEAHEYFEEAHT